MNKKELRAELYQKLFEFWETEEITPSMIDDLIDLVIEPIFREDNEHGSMDINT